MSTAADTNITIDEAFELCLIVTYGLPDVGSVHELERTIFARIFRQIWKQASDDTRAALRADLLNAFDLGVADVDRGVV